MRIELWLMGITNFDFVKDGIIFYSKRLKHNVNFEIKELKIKKSKSEEEHRENEKQQILKNIKDNDYLILLDEKGKQFNSVDFSKYIEKKILTSSYRIIFLIGGPYGFDADLYVRANEKIAMSMMTFPHDLIRVIFLEQLYRAFSIINKKPYHHV